MLFKVVLMNAHLKADLGGFIFNLSWKERSRDRACLKRLKTKLICNNDLELSVHMFSDLL